MHWLLPIVGALIAATASAQESGELATLINTYRSSSQECDGKRMDAVGPLAPEPKLEGVQPASGAPLGEAVKRTGYQPARVQAIVISGPANAKAAMTMLEQRYCRVLSSPQYADLGVSREGNTWRLVFARPLLSPELGDWRRAGREVLEFVNAARREPRTCGERRFSTAPPVEWDAKLAAAALAHSKDMANRNYFRHAGKGGSMVGDRAAGAGYQWRRIGENIATGQGSPKQVVSGWLASPEHCVNIMEPGFTEMGAAYFVNPQSDTTIYWTQVFGTPRR